MINHSIILKIITLTVFYGCLNTHTFGSSILSIKANNATIEVVNTQEIPVTLEAIHEALFSVPHYISPILNDIEIDFYLPNKNLFRVLPLTKSNIRVSDRFLDFRNIRI